ncbi:hypothetical protein DACRYDRAFT_115717 [Dacryopinax primogenitus]|uniref:Novel STAND NTPase 1 domain-containing protein n=1 Tax=Dacryopinax primogenitus (strain DJM 731) TaxID=1858805 RepID=M5GDV2_DACPD|nr:uncharacterized protein DACRYDRAFT_115717 [Dacryopinax primogenitus]EJU02708.1 hypothetical protein DACRYDRAFT_115717 [Dacryopinax primogenitus]
MSGDPSGSDEDSVRGRLGRIKLSLPSNAIFRRMKARIEDMTAKATGITYWSAETKLAGNWCRKRHSSRTKSSKGCSPDTTDTEAIGLLDQFSQALNSIEALMRKQDDPQTPYRQLSQDEIQAQNERLDSIILRFSAHADCNTLLCALIPYQLKNVVDNSGRLIAHDLRLVALEGRGNGSMPFQLPTDMPLMEMPPKPAVFHGRDRLVESIVQRLCEMDNCHIPILGPGGIGKTSVAAAIINDSRVVARYGANRLFMSCEGVPTCDGIASMLAATLRLQHDTDARRIVPIYLASLERALLVVDNAETPLDSEGRVEVESWLGTVAGKPRVSLMITMRGSTPPSTVRWADICRLPLPPLSLTASKHTWLALNSNQDDKLNTLLVALDGLPLAITLMATLDQAATLSDLIDCAIPPTGWSVTVRPTQDSSINGEPKSLCDGPVKTGLAIREKERIRCLAPIREFVVRYHPIPSRYLVDVRQYYMQITEKAQSLRTAMSQESIEYLSSEFSNTLSVLRHFWTERSALSVEHRLKERLTDATFDLSAFSNFSSLGDCTGLLNHALRQLDAKRDRQHAAKCVMRIGDILETKGQLNESMKQYEASIRRYSSIGEQVGISQCRRGMSRVLEKRFKWNQAAAMLEEARIEFQAVGHSLGVAQCTQELGAILRMQTNYKEATTSLEEARIEFQAIGYSLGVAQCTQGIGDILRMQTNYKEARTRLEKAKIEFHGIGHRVGVAQCTQGIGNILRMQAKYEEATTNLEDARTEFQAIRYRLGVAQCTRGIGDILRMQAKYEEATLRLQEARIDSQAMGYRLGVAQCTLLIGDILGKQAKYEEATTRLEEARVGFQAIGDRLGVAQCTRSTSEILRMQAKYEEAIAIMEGVRVEFRTLGLPWDTADCTRSIGDTLGMQGQFGEAIATLEEARKQFEAIGLPHLMEECTKSIDNMRQRQELTSETTTAAWGVNESVGQQWAKRWVQRWDGHHELEYSEVWILPHGRRLRNREHL